MKTEWWAEANGSSTLIYCRFHVGGKVAGVYTNLSNTQLRYMKFPQLLIADCLRRMDEDRKALLASAV